MEERFVEDVEASEYDETRPVTHSEDPKAEVSRVELRSRRPGTGPPNGNSRKKKNQGSVNRGWRFLTKQRLNRGQKGGQNEAKMR